MTTFYYVYSIQYKDVWKYLLWYEDSVNDKLIVVGNKLLTFDSLEKIDEYRKASGKCIINKGDEIVLQEADEVILINNYLLVWNLVSDISNSLYTKTWIESNNNKLNNLYTKLFWHCDNNVVDYYNGLFKAVEKKLLKRIYQFSVRYIAEKCEF